MVDKDIPMSRRLTAKLPSKRSISALDSDFRAKTLTRPQWNQPRTPLYALRPIRD
ncbi:hypothetical protein DSUL_20253 [Desulfovibrionales bacterium]